jgi:hypothetical protein
MEKVRRRSAAGLFPGFHELLNRRISYRAGFGGCVPRRRPPLFACPKRGGRKRAPHRLAPRSPSADGRYPPRGGPFGDGQKLASLGHLPVCFPKRPPRSGCGERGTWSSPKAVQGVSYSPRNALRAASMVLSRSSLLWAALMKPASNWLGARLIPASSMARKKRPKAAVSLLAASAKE